MNPFSLAKLMLLGEICGIGPGTRMLDLACGKGEMLCLFAERFGAAGAGIDIYPACLEAARARARELGVEDAVTLIEGDASAPPDLNERFEVVGCIGATWIGGGLPGTLELMNRYVLPGGWLLVGDVYWAETARADVRARREQEQEFVDLEGILNCCEAAGMDLVEMVLAGLDDWDRYRGSQWLNVYEWLAANPDDPDGPEVRRMRDTSRRDYLAHEPRCLGWGVFVLRAPG